jgi:hypothetical protein
MIGQGDRTAAPADPCRFLIFAAARPEFQDDR